MNEWNVYDIRCFMCLMHNIKSVSSEHEQTGTTGDVLRAVLYGACIACILTRVGSSEWLRLGLVVSIFDFSLIVNSLTDAMWGENSPHTSAVCT